MTKHKTDDYKNSAVKYYLNNENGDGYKKTCKIFDCKKSTLRDWIYKYNTTKTLTRKNRKYISYKITKPQVNTALELLKKNEQLTMQELVVDMKHHYSNFDITPQYLGQIVRTILNMHTTRKKGYNLNGNLQHESVN
jgi:transposase